MRVCAESKADVADLGYFVPCRVKDLSYGRLDEEVFGPTYSW
jgi:hypothetical protein